LRPICRICRSKPRVVKINGQIVSTGGTIPGTSLVVKAISEKQVVLATAGRADEVRIITNPARQVDSLYRLQGSLAVSPGTYKNEPTSPPVVAQKPTARPFTPPTTVWPRSSLICSSCGATLSSRWYRCPYTGRLYCSSCAATRGYVICR
jgi:hypothetical protein